MAKKYDSRSAQIKCTGAQLIAELMTLREFAKLGANLPDHFWNKEPWKKSYVKHIVHANALLKKFSEAAIIRALKTKEGSWQLYLKQDSLLLLYRREQLIIDEGKELALRSETIPVINEQSTSRLNNTSIGKSKLSKLT